MKLYKEIMSTILAKEHIEISFPNLTSSAAELLELTCYNALKRIKEIIEDVTLEDDSCFAKIEEIVNLFEDPGSDGGARHDFG